MDPAGLGWALWLSRLAVQGKKIILKVMADRG
jgi:hypothetical protein